MEANDDLTEIRKAAERSADLTRQLLAFARRQTAAPRILDLNQTVTSMLNMLRRLIGEDISLNWQPSENLWPVKVDPITCKSFAGGKGFFTAKDSKPPNTRKTLK